MKGVKEIEMEKSEAKEAWREYCTGLKGKKGSWLKEYQEAKYAFYNLKEGRKLIDVFEAFKKAGLNGLGFPRLAIAPITSKAVHFKAGFWSGELGSIVFSDSPYSYTSRDFLNLPLTTFDFKDRKETLELNAKVPLVPPRFLPENPKDFYILWEIGKWEQWSEPPKDPFLLKRVSENLFAVFAYWDLTPLERSLIRGR